VASLAEFLNEFAAPRDEMCGTLHTLCSGYRNRQVPGSETDVYMAGTAAVGVGGVGEVGINFE